MALRDYHFEPDYNKAYVSIAEAFYLPCMRSSIAYDRISGYFSSTIYIIAWEALKEFVQSGGKIRLICSPCLSTDDQLALEEGYTGKNDAAVNRALQEEITRMFASPYLDAPARALACLVAQGTIEVKIAVPRDSNNPDISRLFHDKAGTFTDICGDSVGFRGPMNETYKGLSSDGNLESIDVFPSWEDPRDQQRLQRVRVYFEQLWNGTAEGVAVYDFPEAANRILVEKSKGYDWIRLVDEIAVQISISDKWKADKNPGGKKPREHQVNALESWVKNGRHGIFEHATGSGKTYTAMCAIRNALERHEVVMVLVPSSDLLKQWHKEMTENITGLDIQYLLCGDGNNSWRQNNTLHLWTQKSESQHRVILSTMDTATGDQFIAQICQGEHLFLVADEVHRTGSPKRRRFFDVQTGARLGLSATPIRYGDPEGTQAMLDYFGGIIPPPFSLTDAINSGVLTRYFYTPLKISLTEIEQEKWDKLTMEINRLVGRFSNADVIDSRVFNIPSIKMKLLARARIVKEAEAKTQLALQAVQKYYLPGQKWIIYCDNTGQLRCVLSLLLKNGFDAYEYHSDMAGDRETTLDYFSANGGILVSIKCLDEGVDIPSTTHALILASSKNPREFIQRRGRILRKAPGKNFAYLFDAVVIPNAMHSETDRSASIIEAELARAIQFGEGAENPSCIAELKVIAIEHNIDIETVKNGGFEDNDEE